MCNPLYLEIKFMISPIVKISIKHSSFIGIKISSTYFLLSTLISIYPPFFSPDKLFPKWKELRIHKKFEFLHLVVSKMEITEFGSSSPLSNIFFRCFDMAGTLQIIPPYAFV